MSKMQHMQLNVEGRRCLWQLRKLAEENPQFFSGDERLRIILQTPVVRGLLAEFCDKTVPCQRFREVVVELTYLVMANMEKPNGQRFVHSTVVNPLGTEIDYQSLDHHRNIALAIQRAGVFMLPGLCRVQQNVEMYLPWLARDHQTLKALWKQQNLPPQRSTRNGPVSQSLLDVVCATGDSEVEVLNALNKLGYADETITVVSIMSAREGIANILSTHPGVRIHIAALSRFWLTKIGYIRDGPGDAGDRCCGTVDD